MAYQKIDCPEGAEALPNRDKALVVAELSGHGHKLYDLLEVAGLARSSYYYALAHPQQPTRAQLRPKVAKIFSRTPNGCGHRQVAMCLRAEEGERIADKTVLKMTREMGLRCGIRRERAYHRYNSYRGTWGKASRTSSVATSRPMAPGRNWVPMSPSSSSPSVRPTSPPTSHTGTQQEPRKAQGPDPGRIPGSGPTGSRITATIKRVQVSGRSSPFGGGAGPVV